MSPFCTDRSTFLPVVISVLSLIGCCYVIATYCYFPALRRHPAEIMLGMSVYGAIYQLLFLLDQSTSSIHCSKSAIAYFVDVFLTGQETYMLIFAIDLMLAFKNPFSTSRGQMKKYHIYCVLWSLLLAACSQMDAEYALFGFCWMVASDHRLQKKESVLDRKESSLYSWGILFAVYIVIVYCASFLAILKTRKTFTKGLGDTFRTRKRVQRNLKYYVGCYFGYWTMVLASYALFNVFLKTAESARHESDAMECQLWRFFRALLLGKGFVNAIIWTRTSNIRAVIMQLRDLGSVDLPAHEDSINWALRLEILTYTTQGICKGVDLAERQPRASTACSTVSGINPGATCALYSAYHLCGNDVEYLREKKENYAEIAEIVLENRSEGIFFYDYAPLIFRKLRIAAQISCASYRESFQQTTKERVSEGKSGAFFYFTQDRKYVVKTMTHEELRALLCMLPQYCTFIQNQPNTFVTRFFGCHALKMYGKTVFFMVMQSVFDTKLQIHERFDLKGSWVGRLEGRKPTGSLAICKFCSGEYVVGGSHDQLCNLRQGNLRHQYDQVGKDLNWNRHMALPKATARELARQLLIDSDFLCKINCIDYSLLVGIHHRSFNVSHSSPAAQYGENDAEIASSPSMIDGGMTVDAVHGPGIYFIGLIDILQQWNFRKKVEHFIRVFFLLQDRHGISVVHSRQYAERFQQRVVKELIYDATMDPGMYDLRRNRSFVMARPHPSARVLSTNSPRSSNLGRSTLITSFENVPYASIGLSLPKEHSIIDISSNLSHSVKSNGFRRRSDG
uniref:Phosphatidylinositol4phosphate5kinase (PiPIPKD8/GPCRPIPK) putative n=1 Tax=Albugo laibachii Nc14 TaxID=890382 RepID=F0WHQ2_9STRA|nr:phosphatidylinositol4phosphate5kinase (PiPIPKD8/GPCRPIPK) putative [Albugo laibachii Nc14]CCA23717.1 phosphatidylinositol4phosphate5kinase (PiPIPKD8/GPCRPIPK) putative [Albugo laibachii Nc14]|eukprot:CCA23717.1 phosphatidylinositol4phosphate5kinase (PiPIPKD8/GPCRPIPK) putative [Albugo laibachii Nc14]